MSCLPYLFISTKCIDGSSDMTRMLALATMKPLPVVKVARQPLLLSTVSTLVTNGSVFTTPLKNSPKAVLVPSNPLRRTCVDCKKGTKQPNEGTTECLNCIPGWYQLNERQSKCIECEIGRASDVVARDSECDTCAVHFLHWKE